MRLSFRIFGYVAACCLLIGHVSEADAASRKALRHGLEAMSRQTAEASLRFLASDVMGGRLAGSLEGAITAQYIRSELEQMGYGASIREQRFTGRQGQSLCNILVTVPGKDTSRCIVVGAHFDHEGTKNGAVYHGADDNASGTVVLLELARAAQAAGVQPQQSVVFAFWDGEERGLWGSRHYVKTLGQDTSAVAYYINFDMVGRNTDESRPGLFRYFYTASQPHLRTWYEESLRACGLTLLEADYRPSDRTLGGSDNISFGRNGIPIVWFHTDGHPDYNTPNDTADKINYPKLMEIARSSWYLIWRMAY